ncbi:MAG: HlyD family efflux transporter periplasmic adaptor subunit [Rhizobacter sp.]|nr:HlyD family efflux transporter periplasmic adaptor subunit [Rhizobacter sp.]
MERKTGLIGGGAALALALAVAWAFAPRPVEVELATVTQGPFETTIEEDGKTRLTDRCVVSAPLAGQLARITLKEGDAVAVDTPLAVLSWVLPAMLDERSRSQLWARVEAAQDNVSRALSRTARAQVSLDQAQNEVRRSEQLVQQGFIAPIKAETDRLATLGAQREVEGAAAERRMAGHELEQTRAALGSAQPLTADADAGAGAGAANNASGFTVRAPSAGRVLRVLQSSEGVVALGTPLIEVGDTQRMEVVTELLTTDALAAKVGSRVVIERWGGPGVLEGRVRSVEPAAFTKVSALGVEEQRVRVLIDITSPQAGWQALGDGYRVSVRIVTLSEAKAVQVPVSAVFPLPGATDARAAFGAEAGGATGRTLAPARFAVFVADGGRARQTAVELVARNGSAAWIRSGITAGQQVIAYPPAAVRDGLRVAAREP